MTNNCSFTNRPYHLFYNKYFLQLKDELELDIFRSKHVPVLEVYYAKGSQYYVELLDFLNAILPEIGFTSAFIYSEAQSKTIRATLISNHICKHSLDILGNHCKDYMLDASSGCDEEGTPSFTLDVIIPIN